MLSKKEIIEKLRLRTLDVKRDLLGVNLERADLQGISFREAIMMGSSLSESILSNANFSRATIMGADFTKATLIKSDFTYSYGMSAHFEEANLTDSDFRYSFFSGAFFQGATCKNVDFRAAVLMRGNFNLANLLGAVLDDGNLSEANLTNAKLRNASVNNTDFTRANLLGADLRGISFDLRTLKTIMASYDWENAIWDAESKLKAVNLTYLIGSADLGASLFVSNDKTPHKLLLRCRSCGIQFDSKIKTNPHSFATSIYRSMIHTCPNEHTHAYNKEDYTLEKI